jgi:HD-GYP domain-containing protein (c-di-GMP phosphodiesterase class II)
VSGGDRAGVRLAELVGALSLATDLGLGQPMEHVLRQCLIALRLGERLGLSESERAEVYYVGLLAWVGCHSDAHEQARWFGDEIAMKADGYSADLTGLSLAAWVLRHLGAGNPPVRRAWVGLDFLINGRKWIDGMELGHCAAAADLAEQLGLGPEVRDDLQQSFERWDGKGPAGLTGEQIALPVRLVALADVVEVFHRAGGVEAAIAVARERSGTHFDPGLVEVFSTEAHQLLDGLDAATSWDTVIAAEPALKIYLSEDRFDAALEAIADFGDLKSPYTAGHSRSVADLAGEAAATFGLPERETSVLRRAALIHDLGRLGVPNTIWDKPGALTPSEWERVRLHPYLTERMFASSSALAPLGGLASQHHERCDGSGYPRGQSAETLSLAARILAVSDCYRAMREPRPHRPARPRAEAEAELRGEVRAGRLDGDAVNAVLAAAGHRVRRRREWPAGLTPREVEVLCLLARGASNKEIARELVISPKTASNHVEHIYVKIGARTRTAASLFAMRSGLLSEFAAAER